MKRRLAKKTERNKKMENISEELSGMQLLSKELETARGNEKAIGDLIIKEFSDVSNGLDKAWKERGLNLTKLWEMIMAEARTNLKSKSGAVDDQTVLGWANHLIIDGKIPDNRKNPLINEGKNSESEGQDDDGEKSDVSKYVHSKSKKRNNASAEEAKKESKSESPFIQLSLFDLNYGKTENAPKVTSK